MPEKAPTSPQKAAKEPVKKPKTPPSPRQMARAALAARHAKSQNSAQARAAYAKRKAHVMLLEEFNDDSIIVFKSIDEPWHKIGWKSALIYAYDVAIRACKKRDLPTIRKDTDHEVRSPDGIIFIRSFKKFIDRLRNIGINDYEELPDGIYIFKVKKKYTKTEIKEFRNIKYQTGDELFSLTAEKRVYPELRGLIVKAAATILPKCKKIHSFYQMTLGKHIAEAICDMNYAYFDLANRRGEKKDHLVRIVESANTILANLTMLQELELWHPIEMVEAGSLMVDIKASIRRLTKKEESGGQPG